jgi:hypothetical protein
MAELDKIFLYRITHLQNIKHILQYGITHYSSINKNPAFVSIGDASLINSRNTFLLPNGKRLGSYITGYSSKDKKPFEELEIVPDGADEVKSFLQLSENKDFLKIADNTATFLNGFYSPFGLELLSTIDFIIREKKLFQLKKLQSIFKNGVIEKKPYLIILISLRWQSDN